MSDEYLDRIPEGWRLNSIDASIPGRYAVLLVRAGKDYERWFHLTEEQQEDTALVVNGVGETLMGAFDRACLKATGEGGLT